MNKIFNCTKKIESFVIDEDGEYIINAFGAQGGSVGSPGSSYHEGGKGAFVSGVFKLYKGDILYILVGEAGTSKGWSDWGGGGGGGSFVVRKTTNTEYLLNAGINQYVEPLIVAAGGGGAGDDGCGAVGNGQTIAGYGGFGRYETAAEGCGTSSLSGGGAGFVINSLSDRGHTAYSFLNGGAGSPSGNSYVGGFGGGGAPYDGGGGGGGWHGGDSLGNNTGMGGYSYNSGNSKLGFSGSNNGNGIIQICKKDITIYDYDFSNNIETFIAPYDGFYKLECWGASGGGANRDTCGLGAYSTSIVELKIGDTLKLLVAGKGEWDGARGGGGGGSFIEAQPGRIFNSKTLLCVAGGGGGSIFSRATNNFSHGQSGKYASNYSLTGFLTGLGTAGRSDLASGTGGAGYANDSAICYNDIPSFCDPLIIGAKSFKNGGAAGYGTGGRNNGGYYETMAATPKGGFGGGGSSSFLHCIGNSGGRYGYYRDGAGGGGGYSGGDSSRDGYANSAGGGSSYYLSISDKLSKYSFAKAGYEYFRSPSGEIESGNFGNGFIRITLSKYSYYALLKDENYYIPTKKFFNGNSYTPVSLDYLKNKNNIDDFVKDLSLMINSEVNKHINLLSCKIVKFIIPFNSSLGSEGLVNGFFTTDVSFNYDPIKSHLLKGNVIINITNDNNLDYNIIKNIGTNNIKVGISNSKYIYGKDMCKITKDEILDKGIDINDLKKYIIPFDNYKLIMCFTDGDVKLSEISHIGFNNYKYKNIADKNIEITTDLKNIYISSDKAINKLLINKLPNDKVEYSKLEKVY